MEVFISCTFLSLNKILINCIYCHFKYTELQIHTVYIYFRNLYNLFFIRLCICSFIGHEINYLNSKLADTLLYIVLIFLKSGKRPFGVSILYMGWDKHYGYQLYQSDPSGNYSGWKATCIGNNSAVSIRLT